MKRNLIPILILVLAAALAAACVPKPRMQYTKEQLQGLHEKKELMRVLYHGLTPVWDSAKKSTYAAADFKTMARAAPRVVAVSQALLSKKVSGKYPDEFARHATELGKHAAALEKAATAAQEPQARKAIKGINAACKSCHKTFK